MAVDDREMLGSLTPDEEWYAEAMISAVDRNARKAQQ
jgi:hypothetical protein